MGAHKRKLNSPWTGESSPLGRGSLTTSTEACVLMDPADLGAVREINAHLPFADPIWLNVTFAGVELPIRRDTYRQADARARFERRRQRLIDRLKFAEVVGCACGRDHDVMPTDVDGTELVCRVHKRHIPCRRCLHAVDD